jgi:hypothetical protein
MSYRPRQDDFTPLAISVCGGKITFFLMKLSEVTALVSSYIRESCFFYRHTLRESEVVPNWPQTTSDDFTGLSRASNRLSTPPKIAFESGSEWPRSQITTSVSATCARSPVLKTPDRPGWMASKPPPKPLLDARYPGNPSPMRASYRWFAGGRLSEGALGL